MCTNREFGHPTHCILHTQYILHTVVPAKPVVLLLSFDWQIWSDWLWRFCTRHFLIRIGRGTKPVSSGSPFIFISFSLQLFVFPKKCTRFRRLISQFMLIAHRRRWCNLQNSSKYPCCIRVLSCILPSIPCLTAHNTIKNDTKTLITS